MPLITTTTHLNIRMQTHAYTHRRAHEHAYAHAHAHAHARAHTHKYVHVHAHVHFHTHTRNLLTRAHTHHTRNRAFWAMVAKQAETLGSWALHSMSASTAAAGRPDRSAVASTGMAPRTIPLTLGSWCV